MSAATTRADGGDAMRTSAEAPHSIATANRSATDEHLATEEREKEEHNADKLPVNDKLPDANKGTEGAAPPLPEEVAPPLPEEDAPTVPQNARPLPVDAQAGGLPYDETPEDDGWVKVWDYNHAAFYYTNRFTGVSQWTDPRAPEAGTAVSTYAGYGSVYAASSAAASAYTPTAAVVSTSAYEGYGYPGYGSAYAPTASAYGGYGAGQGQDAAYTGGHNPYATFYFYYYGYPQTAAGLTGASGVPGTTSPRKRVAGGYNPAIHGNYDPNADYAKEVEREEEEAERARTNAAIAASTAAYGRPAFIPDNTAAPDYMAKAAFNRFTHQYQHASINPENHNDENKSRRQQAEFYDVEAAANSHDGRSLKAERRNKPISAKQLRVFKKKKEQKKTQKERQWLLE